MSKEKIQSIRLNNFRGATKPLEIDFDSKKSMVMIFGENGTGKSTLVDAIDFIFNKECGTLKDRSSTNIRHHLPSVGSNSQDVDVLINSQNFEWKGKLNGLNPTVEGDEKLLSVRILRRSKILELVNAEPRKRYEALKNFIELIHIRSSEKSLRECIQRIQKQYREKHSNQARTRR